MPKGQEGFTLIELVITIVIIGLLAAAALPRFIDITDEAEQAGYQGVQASLAGGISLAHSKYLAQNLSGAQNMDMSGVAVAMNASGWPDATAAGLLNTMSSDPSESANWTFTGGSANTVGTLTFAPTGSTISYDPNNGALTAQ